MKIEKCKFDQQSECIYVTKYNYLNFFNYRFPKLKIKRTELVYNDTRAIVHCYEDIGIYVYLDCWYVNIHDYWDHYRQEEFEEKFRLIEE